MNIYFNKGTANEEVVLESDILNMDKPALKVLKMKLMIPLSLGVKNNILRSNKNENL